MNSSRVMAHLFSAMQHALLACERTRRLVAIAVARFRALLAIQAAAA